MQKRKRILIDRFQTYMILRIGVYCLVFQVSVWALVLLYDWARTAQEGLSGAPSPYLLLVPVVGGLVITAGFMYDGVRFAHRLVGPLYRFRKTMQAVVAGDEVRLIQLRRDDFLVEMRDDLNALLLHLERSGVIELKTAAGQPTAGQPQPS